MLIYENMCADGSRWSKSFLDYSTMAQNIVEAIKFGLCSSEICNDKSLSTRYLLQFLISFRSSTSSFIVSSWLTWSNGKRKKAFSLDFRLSVGCLLYLNLIKLLRSEIAQIVFAKVGMRIFSLFCCQVDPNMIKIPRV